MEAPPWLKGFSAQKNKRRAACEADEHTNLSKTDSDYMSCALTAAQPNISVKKQVNSKSRPLKEIMDEALERGLVKPIEQDNVGFKLVCDTPCQPL